MTQATAILSSRDLNLCLFSSLAGGFGRDASQSFQQHSILGIVDSSRWRPRNLSLRRYVNFVAQGYFYITRSHQPYGS